MSPVLHILFPKGVNVLHATCTFVLDFMYEIQIRFKCTMSIFYRLIVLYLASFGKVQNWSFTSFRLEYVLKYLWDFVFNDIFSWLVFVTIKRYIFIRFVKMIIRVFRGKWNWNIELNFLGSYFFWNVWYCNWCLDFIYCR